MPRALEGWFAPDTRGPKLLPHAWVWFYRALVVAGFCSFVMGGCGTWILSGRALLLSDAAQRDHAAQQMPVCRPRPQELAQQHALRRVLAGADLLEHCMRVLLQASSEALCLTLAWRTDGQRLHLQRRDVRHGHRRQRAGQAQPGRGAAGAGTGFALSSVIWAAVD